MVILWDRDRGMKTASRMNGMRAVKEGTIIKSTKKVNFLNIIVEIEYNLLQLLVV